MKRVHHIVSARALWNTVRAPMIHQMRKETQDKETGKMVLHHNDSKDDGEES